MFVTHFLNVDEKKTLKEISVISGYSLNTILQWSRKYKWFERKRARQAYDAEEERKQIKKLTYERLQQKNKRAKTNETDLDLWTYILHENLKDFAGVQPEDPPRKYKGLRLTLSEAQSIQDLLRRGNIGSNEDIRQLNELDDYFRTESTDKDRLTELAERAAEIRFYDNKEAEQKLKEEYENEDY